MDNGCGFGKTDPSLADLEAVSRRLAGRRSRLVESLVIAKRRHAGVRSQADNDEGTNVTVLRVPVELQGFAGGPGVNIWHVTSTGGIPGYDADSITTAFSQFYDDASNRLQSDVTAVIPNTFLIYDVASGQPLEPLTGTIGPQQESGSGGNAFSHFTSYKVQARTLQYEDGRELRGGVFLGPAEGTIDADGSWAAAGLAQLDQALTDLATALTTAGQPLVVYRQPRPAGSLPAREGSVALVQQISAWNLPAVQRSRRQ